MIPREQRTSKHRPCPACGHTSWCAFTPDGLVVWCGRESRGAFRAGERGGWLHHVKGAVAVPATERPGRPPARHRNFEKLANRWRLLAQTKKLLPSLARSLGVSHLSLVRLQVGWAPAAALKAVDTRCRWEGCWTFPMFDGRGRVAGVRLRSPDGQIKYCVDSSDGSGLFVPENLPIGQDLLVPEGPTSLAALLDLGFAAVGRPNNTGGIEHLKTLLAKLRPPRVVFVGDNDPPDKYGRLPGQDGARSAAAALASAAPSVGWGLPPPQFKDSRKWAVQGGATAAEAATRFGVALPGARRSVA